MSSKNIDYLTQDEPIHGQTWVCLSFLSPEGIKNCNLRGLKIRGVYGTRDEAEARAKYLSKMDPDFDIFVGEMGKWLPWNPDPNDVENQEYQEEKLNEIMKEHKNSLVKARQLEEARKREMLEKAAVEENQKVLNKTQQRLKNKLKQKQAKESAQSLPPPSPVTPVESSVSSPPPPPSSSSSIDEQLDKIKELYSNLKKGE